MPRKLPLTIFILLQIFNIPAVAGALRNVSISINNPAVDFSSGWHVRHSRILEGSFAFTHEADDVRILLPERTVSLHYYGLQTHHHSTFIACLDCEPFQPDLARAKLVNTWGSSYGYDLQPVNLFSMTSLDPEQIHTLTIVNLCDSRYDDECILVFDHLVVIVQEDNYEPVEDDTEEEFEATLSPRYNPNIQVTMAISAAAPSQISIVTQTSIKTITMTQTAAPTTLSSVSPIPTSTIHTSSSASGSSSVAPSKTESHSQSSASPIKTASSTSHVNTQSGSSTTRTSSTSISATPHTHSSTTSVSSRTSSSISSHTSKTTPITSSNSHSTITTHPRTSSAIASPTLLPNTSSAADNNATIALGHNTLAVLIAILVFVATLSVLLGIIVFSPRIRAWLGGRNEVEEDEKSLEDGDDSPEMASRSPVPYRNSYTTANFGPGNPPPLLPPSKRPVARNLEVPEDTTSTDSTSGTSTSSSTKRPSVRFASPPVSPHNRDNSQPGESPSVLWLSRSIRNDDGTSERAID